MHHPKPAVHAGALLTAAGSLVVCDWWERHKLGRARTVEFVDEALRVDPNSLLGRGASFVLEMRQLVFGVQLLKRRGPHMRQLELIQESWAGHRIWGRK